MAFFTRLRSEVQYTTPILPVTFLFPFCVHDNAEGNRSGEPLGKKITQPSTEPQSRIEVTTQFFLPPLIWTDFVFVITELVSKPNRTSCDRQNISPTDWKGRLIETSGAIIWKPYCHAVVAWEKKPPLVSHWRLRNERSNSILMTCHYADLENASDWLKQIFNQSEALPRSGYWHVISMEFLRSFHRRHLVGKPSNCIVESQKVGCFQSTL